jgi:chromosome segregation ATPase
MNFENLNSQSSNNLAEQNFTAKKRKPNETVDNIRVSHSITKSIFTLNKMIPLIKFDQEPAEISKLTENELRVKLQDTEQRLFKAKQEAEMRLVQEKQEAELRVQSERYEKEQVQKMLEESERRLVQEKQEAELRVQSERYEKEKVQKLLEESERRLVKYEEESHMFLNELNRLSAENDRLKTALQTAHCLPANPRILEQSKDGLVCYLPNEFFSCYALVFLYCLQSIFIGSWIRKKDWMIWINHGDDWPLFSGLVVRELYDDYLKKFGSENVYAQLLATLQSRSYDIIY